VDFPIERLLLSVFLPDRLQTAPLPLVVTRRRNNFPDELRAITDGGHYRVERSSADGQPGWSLTLDRPEPPIKARYQLCWQPPSQAVLDRSGVDK
jgi:hypothetical protein